MHYQMRGDHFNTHAAGSPTKSKNEQDNYMQHREPIDQMHEIAKMR